MEKIQNLFYFKTHALEPINVSGSDLFEVSVKSGIYFMLGYGSGIMLNKILPEYNESKSQMLILFELFYSSLLMGVMMYLVTVSLEYGSKSLFGPTACNKYHLMGLMFMLPLFSVQTEFKKKMSHFIDTEKFENKDDDDEEEIIMKRDNNPQNESTPDKFNMDTLQRELHSNSNQNQPSQANSQYYKDEIQVQDQRNEHGQNSGCGCGSDSNSHDQNLEKRVNGYCASSDQSCNGQWTDTKIKGDMFGGYGGLVATNLGAPIM